MTNSPRPSPPIPSAQAVATSPSFSSTGEPSARASLPEARVLDAAIQWKPLSGLPAGIAGSPRRATSFSIPGSGSGDMIGRKRPLSKS